jgi:succinyl-CoA:acetate CoA-transferase
VVLADCPELVARVGLIAMNSGIEVDIYGHVNSTHIQGSRIVSGIGGSCDFMWNAFLSVVLLSSTARRGAISCIVPMVTHVDHPEHAVDVIVTEQGLADLRGLAPVERARTIIANCAHPDYKPLLSQYLEEAINSRGGHEPHMLEKAFSFHLRFAETGSMKP